jgi:hypothetical protein
MINYHLTPITRRIGHVRASSETAHNFRVHLQFDLAHLESADEKLVKTLPSALMSYRWHAWIGNANFVNSGAPESIGVHAQVPCNK